MHQRLQFAAAMAAIVMAVLSLFVPARLSWAQNAPTDTASPAAPAPPAAEPATPPPPAATIPAPAASPAPTTATQSDTERSKEAAPASKERKKRTRMTRQQEIEHSLRTGTVPSRYRSSVPRQYQKYIPFEK